MEQIPNYVKFLKDILSKRRKSEESGRVALNKEVSAILQKKLPPKLKDLRSFSIPCIIGNISFACTLCDLGVSINFMPLTVFKKYGLDNNLITC